MNKPRKQAMVALTVFITLAVVSTLIPAVATALTILAITVFLVGGLVVLGVLIEFNITRRVGHRTTEPTGTKQLDLRATTSSATSPSPFC